MCAWFQNFFRITLMMHIWENKKKIVKYDCIVQDLESEI
jgi:hypothetical protein